jgi:hypothetical protein
MKSDLVASMSEWKGAAARVRHVADQDCGCATEVVRMSIGMCQNYNNREDSK